MVVQVESLSKALSQLRERDVTEQRAIIEGFIKLKKNVSSSSSSSSRPGCQG